MNKVPKRKDLDVIKTIVDKKNQKIGKLKRVAENEVGYIFGSDRSLQPTIHDVKAIGFNTRKFTNNFAYSGHVPSEQDFEATTIYDVSTSYLIAVNGNLVDANLPQYINAFYATELYAETNKTVAVDFFLATSDGEPLPGNFAIMVNGSMSQVYSFGNFRKTISIELEGGKFTQVVIFLYTESVGAQFHIAGNLALNVDSWRLPEPSVPRWILGYPTNRNHKQEIELSWETDSVLAIGDTAVTSIEYALSSGGPFVELARVDYDTHTYVHGALSYNNTYWYRLRTTDITSNVSDYSDTKQGSTYFGNFPVITLTVKKNGEEYAYYKSGDVLDIEAVSSVELTEIPECIIEQTANSATGEATCYGSDELGMYNTYYYQANSNAQTTVNDVSPAMMPEGIGSVYVRGNTFGNTSNLVINGNFEARYIVIPEAMDAYVEASGWTRNNDNGDAASYPSYDYTDSGGGIVGNRHVTVGGPYSIGHSFASGNDAYGDGGCSFYQEVAVDESTEYAFSFFSRVADYYGVPYRTTVTGWQGKVILKHLEGSEGNTVLSTEEIVFNGSRDWQRTESGFTTPATAGRTRIELVTNFTENYTCHGDFYDLSWWNISGDGDVSYHASGVNDTATANALFVSGNDTIYIHQMYVGVDNLPQDMMCSIWIKPLTESVTTADEVKLQYRSRLAGGSYTAWVETGGLFVLPEFAWGRASWLIPSANIDASATAIGYQFILPSGRWVVTCAQMESGTSVRDWVPGNLQIDYDGIMVESGGTNSSSYRGKEDEYGAYSIDTRNTVYFDYTAPVGSFYISAIREFTSNADQLATTSRSSYIIPQGIDGATYPYDEYGIRYIYIMNSGTVGGDVPDETGMIESGTRFEYVQGVSYSWELDTTGQEPAGTGTGIRQVYCMYEDKAGNRSSISSDTITYVDETLPAPTGLSATGDRAGSNLVEWFALGTANDPYSLLSHYEVYSWTATGDVYDIAASIWNDNTDSVSSRQTGVASNTAYHYSVRSVDIAGQKGDWATYVTCTSFNFTDDVAPAPPYITSLTSTGDDNPWGGYDVYVDALVGHSGENENSTPCIDLHILETAVRKSGEEDWTFKQHIWDVAPDVFPTGVHFYFHALEANTWYYFKARAIDFNNTPSDWCAESGIKTGNDIEPPDAVSWFELYGLFEKVHMNWEPMNDWGAKQFILLRGDYTITSGNIQAAISNGDDTFYLDSTTSVSGNYFLVIEPGEANEGRYFIKETGAGNTVTINGYASNSHADNSEFAIYQPVATPYRGPYADTNCEIETTYYYNILAMDNRYNISEPYGSTKLTVTGYTDWPQVTTKGIESVDVAWDFLSEATTINKIKNSSFEIQSGDDATDAMFWDNIGVGDYVRQASSSTDFGDYDVYMNNSRIIAQHFPLNASGEHTISLYVKAPSSETFNQFSVIMQQGDGASWGSVGSDYGSNISAADTWERHSFTRTFDATTYPSGRIVISSFQNGLEFDAIMVQEGPWLTQYMPYSDEFILGTEMITSVEITSGAITAPKIAANAVLAQHIMAGAIGTHHLTVANRIINAADIYFFPNRQTPHQYWETDTSDPDWPVGDSSWDASAVFWSGGTVLYQSGSTPVGTANQWIEQTLASGSYNGSVSSTYYFAFKYEVNTSGEPIDGGTTAVEVFETINALSQDPATGYARTLVGILKTGTTDDDPQGATWESVGTLGTTINGNQIKTGSIEARMIVVGAIHAEQIAAAAINSVHISSYSIEAHHMTIGASPRAYGHTVEFEPWGSIFLTNTSDGYIYITGEEYYIDASQFVYSKSTLGDDTVGYIYFDTEGAPVAPADASSYLGGTGEMSELVSGRKYPLAVIRWTTDGNGSAGWEIQHIRAYGTYLDGGRIIAQSIITENLAVDCVDATIIAADAVQTEHFSGEHIEGVSYRANSSNGSIHMNYDGDSSDIRIYDATDTYMHVDIGRDIESEFNEFMPEHIYGVRISSGAFLINNSDRELDYSEAGMGWDRHTGIMLEYTNTQDVWWPRRDAPNLNYIDQYNSIRSSQYFMAKGSPVQSADNDWVHAKFITVNAATTSTPSVTYVNGIRGLELITMGDGYGEVKNDYGDGPYSSSDIIQKGSVVGIYSDARKISGPPTNRVNSDVIAGAFYAYAGRSSSADGRPIAIVAMAEGDSQACALMTYGNIGLSKGKIVYDSGGSPIDTGGKGTITVKNLDFVATSDSGDLPLFGTESEPFGGMHVHETGHMAVGDAKIKQLDSLPYFESGAKVAAGKEVYFGAEKIWEESGVLRVSTVTKATPSGLYPSETTSGVSDLGKPVEGEEWHSIFLSDVNEEESHPGIYWNRGTAIASGNDVYAEIYGRHGSGKGLSILYLKTHGSFVDSVGFDINAYSGKIFASGEFHATNGIKTYGSITPDTDSSMNIGSDTFRFSNVYADNIVTRTITGDGNGDSEFIVFTRSMASDVLTAPAIRVEDTFTGAEFTSDSAGIQYIATYSGSHAVQKGIHSLLTFDGTIVTSAKAICAEVVHNAGSYVAPHGFSATMSLDGETITAPAYTAGLSAGVKANSASEIYGAYTQAHQVGAGTAYGYQGYGYNTSATDTSLNAIGVKGYAASTAGLAVGVEATCATINESGFGLYVGQHSHFNAGIAYFYASQVLQAAEDKTHILESDNGSVWIENKLEVDGDAFFDSDATVSGDLTVTGDLDVTGEMSGARCMISLGRYNNTTSSTYLRSAGLASQDPWDGTEGRGIPQMRDGSIVGFAANFKWTETTTGTIEFVVYVNTTSKWTFEVDVNGTDTYTVYDTQARGTDTYSAGDIIAVRMNFTNGATGTVANTAALLEIVQDT